MTMRTWIRRLFAAPIGRTIRKARLRNRLRIEILEDRIAPAALDYFAIDGTPLTLRLFGNAQLLQVVNSQTPDQVLASGAVARPPASGSTPTGSTSNSPSTPPCCSFRRGSRSSAARVRVR